MGKSKPKYPALDDIIHKYKIIEPYPYAEGAFKKGFLVKPEHNVGAPLIDPNKTYVMKIFKPSVDITADTALQNMEYVDHNVRDIFHQEIQKLDRIGKHPNIARIVDAGTYQVSDAPFDLFYFVEEYVEGRTLSDILKATKIHSAETDKLKETGIINTSGFIDYEFAASVAHQIAKGIKHLHTEAKMAHSDVKPSNILISSNFSTAVLTDFGSATVLRDTAYFQLGSVLYRAPETFRDLSKTGDDSLPKPKTKLPADKWALGVVMYEMLTGRYPFETDPADWSGLEDEYLVRVQTSLEKNIRRMKLERPSVYNKDVTTKMDELVMSLLQRNPSLRIDIDKAVRKLGGFISNFERKTVPQAEP